MALPMGAVNCKLIFNFQKHLCANRKHVRWSLSLFTLSSFVFSRSRTPIGHAPSRIHNPKRHRHGILFRLQRTKASVEADTDLVALLLSAQLAKKLLQFII